MLADPGRVTDQHCATYLTERGKGWVCIIDEEIVGFSIIDFVDPSIWALFVLPCYENRRVGKSLLNLMLEEYFSTNNTTLWLTTSPQTRAETFYRKNGWIETGMEGKEIKFTLSKEDWLRQKQLAGNKPLVK